MIRFVEATELNEGVTFYTLEGALETFKRFKDFQDFALSHCGSDDDMADTLDKLGKRIEELIVIRNTEEFSHEVSEDFVNLPNGSYSAIWNGYTIEFENGLEIEVAPYETNMENVRKSKENPFSVKIRVWDGRARVFGYDI